MHKDVAKSTTRLAPLISEEPRDIIETCAVEPCYLLKCVSGCFKGGSIHINRSEKVCCLACPFVLRPPQGDTIGSTTDASIVSVRLAAEGVESEHCRLNYDPTTMTYTLVDLSAESGTWVKLWYVILTAHAHPHYPSVERSVLTHLPVRLDVNGEIITVEVPEAGSAPTFEGMENSSVEITSRDDGVFAMRVTDKRRPMFLTPTCSHVLCPGDVIRLGSLSFEVRRFSFGSASVQGIRPSMEDEDLCEELLVMCDGRKEWISMFNVYDGHGSFECSMFLKKHFHTNFSNAAASSIDGALIEAFRLSESQFLAYSRERGLSQNIGSVVTSVVVTSDRILCGNLGDSRAVLCLKDDTVIELSRDLKPSVPDETDRIKRCGGFVSGNRVMGRLAVSRAIGDFEFKSNICSSADETMVSSVPEIRMHRLTGNDAFILIACDGLYDVMSSTEAAEFVSRRITQFVNRKEEPDPDQICVDLITECVMKRGTTDNVTVVVVFLTKFT